MLILLQVWRPVLLNNIVARVGSAFLRLLNVMAILTAVTTQMRLVV